MNLKNNYIEITLEDLTQRNRLILVDEFGYPLDMKKVVSIIPLIDKDDIETKDEVTP